MGYLAIKDLGMIGVQTTNGLIEGIVANQNGAINPPTNNGILNIKAFTLTFNTGKVVNSNPNIAGNITRLATGSTKPVELQLSISLTRQPNKANTDAIKYLTAWARTKTTLVLFYMPNDSSVSLSYGQDPDFFYSQLKTIYDVVWDKNLSGNPYGTNTYGSSWYNTGVTIDGAIYKAAAVPIILEDISVKNEASTYSVDVTVSGYALENEAL